MCGLPWCSGGRGGHLFTLFLQFVEFGQGSPELVEIIAVYFPESPSQHKKEESRKEEDQQQPHSQGGNEESFQGIVLVDAGEKACGKARGRFQENDGQGEGEKAPVKGKHSNDFQEGMTQVTSLAADIADFPVVDKK